MALCSFVSRSVAVAIALLVLAACAEDFVGRDEVANDTCGDDVKGPTEDCDNDGPGYGSDGWVFGGSFSINVASC